MFLDTFCVFGEIIVILKHMTDFNNFTWKVASTVRARLVSHQQQEYSESSAKKQHGTGEVAVLAEDEGSIPSTHMAAYISL